MRSTRERRKARLLEEAEGLIDELLDWTDSTPEPNLTQIEDMVLQLRKRFGDEMAERWWRPRKGNSRQWGLPVRNAGRR